MNLLLLSRSAWFCKLHNVNLLRFEILESLNQLDVCFSFHFLLRVTYLSTVLSRNHKFLENLLKKACLLWSLPFSDNCPSSAFFSLVIDLFPQQFQFIFQFSTLFVVSGRPRFWPSTSGWSPPVSIWDYNNASGIVQSQKSHVNFKIYQRVWIWKNYSPSEVAWITLTNVEFRSIAESLNTRNIDIQK